MDYDTLEDALTTGSSGPGAGPGRARGSGLPREAVTAALEEIASGRRELQAVRHPLGFLCLPFVREGERGVCVHLFGTQSTGGQPPEAQTHAHSWELRSHVLYGRVSNVPVRVREETGRPTHRIFEVHSGPAGVDEVRPTARLVHSEPGPELTSAGGQTYTLPAGEFHSTLVARGPAATLVLGRSLPGRTDLVLGPLRGGGHSTVRRLCGAEDTRQTVRTALRRVHAEQCD